MENKNQNSEWVTRFSCMLSSVMKKWRIILLAACLCGSLFDIYKTLTYQPLYSASTIVAIMDGDGKGLDGDSALKAVSTIRYMLNSQYMKNQVNEKLDQSSFQGNINVNVTADTNLCTIGVLAHSQKDAYVELKSMINLYKEVSQRSKFGYYFNTVEDVSFSNWSLNSNSHKRNYQIGFLVSFVLGCVVVLMISYLKDNVKTPNDISDKIDARLYAKIPKELKRNQKWSFLNPKKSAILVSHFHTGFSYVEAMNKLANKVEASSKKHGYQSYLITSSLENEGKSSVAVNLAISMAKNKHRVLLIDADLRKPSLHKIFERHGEVYLCDILNQKKEWKEGIVSLEREHLDVIFSKPYEDTQRILSSNEFEKLLAEVKKEYDYVIIDSAPSRYVTDTSMFASLCDAVFMVVRQNTASCKMINDTIYQLVNVNANVIGTIYNGSVVDITRSHSAYGYRYGYYRYHREGRSS